MLTEGIMNVECPVCKYNKLFQRYGSQGYYQLDGCPNCGFGYGSNHYDPDSGVGFQAWKDYGLHILASYIAGTEVEYPEILKDRLKETGRIDCQSDEDWLQWHNKYEEIYSRIRNELSQLSDDDLRKKIFDMVEEDKDGYTYTPGNTVFKYDENDVNEYIKTNPLIFKK